MKLRLHIGGKRIAIDAANAEGFIDGLNALCQSFDAMLLNTYDENKTETFVPFTVEFRVTSDR